LTDSSPYTKDFAIAVSGPAGPGSGGTLTINGLPSGGTRAVYVFSPGTDISTYTVITTAYTNGSYQALGASLSSDGTFTLYTWSGGAQGSGFTGNGSCPVLLLSSSGSITDTANPVYARATVSFSNGTGTAAYSGFTAVIDGSDTGFQINFTGPTGSDINVDGGFKLSKSESAYSAITISVENDEEYDSFRWLVEGQALSGETGGSVTLTASSYNAGAYRLTAIAEKDGVPYSREFPFAVVN
jgi:hypothetical protein